MLEKQIPRVFNSTMQFFKNFYGVPCIILLSLKDLFISESCIEIKIELNFYFHTSLWCLETFYEGLKGLHKTF